MTPPEIATLGLLGALVLVLLSFAFWPEHQHTWDPYSWRRSRISGEMEQECESRCGARRTLTQYKEEQQ